MSKVICAKMGIGDCSLVADIEHLQSELSAARAENKRLKEILEKERVVQRRIHQIFRHLSSQVELGWESCLQSFGMGEGRTGNPQICDVCRTMPCACGITHDKDGKLVPSPSK